jgi:hypothetical protein
MLPHHGGFTALIIISDKPNDSTINELLPLIHVRIIQIDYDHAEGVLNEIIEGKTAYDKVVRKDLEGELTEESKQDILSKTCDDDFYNELPHTFILLDDAINILTQKKYKKLQQMLFRNRQPRFTICICVQDLTGVPPQVRRNLDSLWLFGGNVSRQNFMYLLNQCYPDVKDKKEIILENYRKLSVNQILLFTYDRDGTKVEVL